MFVHEKRLRQPRLGTRKLHNLMHSEPEVSVKVGRDCLFDILRGRRELVPRKRAYHKTTNSHHRFHRHPNLLKEGPSQVVATAPEQVWVADITYLPTQAGVAYLSLVTDAYSRKIVGHHVHESLHTESVIQAFSKALKCRTTEQNLVHHFDSGDFQAAESWAQKTLDGRESDIDIGPLINVGMVFLELGKNAEAYKAFDEAYGFGQARAFQERPKKYLNFYLDEKKKSH